MENLLSTAMAVMFIFYLFKKDTQEAPGGKKEKTKT
jgi:hypothetical protein